MFSPDELNLSHLPPFEILSGTTNVPSHLKHLCSSTRAQQTRQTRDITAGPGPVASNPIGTPQIPPATSALASTTASTSTSNPFAILIPDKPAGTRPSNTLKAAAPSPVHTALTKTFKPPTQPRADRNKPRTHRRAKSSYSSLPIVCTFPNILLQLSHLFSKALHEPRPDKKPKHYWLDEYEVAARNAGRASPEAAAYTRQVVDRHLGALGDMLFEMTKKLRCFQALGNVMDGDAEKVRRQMREGVVAFVGGRLKGVMEELCLQGTSVALQE